MFAREISVKCDPLASQFRDALQRRRQILGNLTTKSHRLFK